MNIVCSADNNYIQHCCVMLISFFENNREEKHTVHFLTEGVEQAHQEFIRNIVHSYQGKFFYYLVRAEFLESCPIRATDHLTIATYNRLFMAEILPDNIDKVLYLDCDIVVNHSISEFWEMPLDAYAIAAVEELGCSAEDAYERLGYDIHYGYFNAGVLLVNLDYWRTHNLTHAFLDYIRCNFDKLRAHDQDVLNALLYDKCLHVSYEWNVEEAFYHYSVIKRLEYNGELRYILRHPKILHYTWKPKPWDASCRHPFRINYFCYLGKVRKAPLPFRKKLQALYDKYYFCLLLLFRIKGHKHYRI